MHKFLEFLGIIFLFYLAITPLMLDSTDRDMFHKSDLKLHIDNQTGCHYLSTWWGYITPRLDKDGNQVCTGYLEE